MPGQVGGSAQIRRTRGWHHTAQVAGVLADNAGMHTLRETEYRPAGDKLLTSRSPHPPAVSAEALLPGSRLDEFEIVRVLGAGGFGIVYLALDQVLLRYVAIKEFIPTALAARTPQGGVAVRSPEASETFEVGLDSFYNEGRLLARFDNPSLVRVFRFWKANGTAYMAMQHYPGQTLREARRQMPAAPDEAWLRLFLDRLLGALQTLHAQGVYHRDIAPDNILLLPDGQPVILDFGSARRVISDRTQSLMAILKPNYSPIEQYADDAGMRQGCYTDLYALGGTVYFMLTGKEPIPSVLRAVRDSFPVLAQSSDDVLASMSHQFLAALDWALSVAPGDRPQTVDDFDAALRGEIEPPPPSERSGVLIPDPNQAYDAARAMAKTELAVPRSIGPSARAAQRQAVPAAEKAAAGAGRLGSKVLLASGLASVMLSAALLWTLLGTPSHSSAKSPAAIASAPVAALSPLAPIEPSSTSPVAPVVVADPAPKSAPPSVPPSLRVTAKVPRHAPYDIPRATPMTEAEQPSLPRVSTQAHAIPHTAAISSPSLEDPTRALEGAAVMAPAPTSPCTGMNLFARAACLSRVCDVPPWNVHPQCVETRRIAEQRLRRMEQ